MRIAYVCADFGVPVFGTNGSSAHVRAILRAFLAHGAKVDLFASRPGGEPPADLAAVRLHKLPRAPRELPQEERERIALKANAELARGLVVNGPYDLVYERHALWSASGMVAARALGVPALLEVNAPLLEETARFRLLVDRAAAERQVERAFAAADALLAVSTGVAHYLDGFLQTTGLQTAGKIRVLPNGVDPDRFTPAGRQRRPGEPFTLGFLGSLRPWHGLDGLIEAVRLMAARGLPVRLLVVGKGPEQEALVVQAETAGIARLIEWTGAVPEEAVPAQLARMDIAIAPYPGIDGFYFSPLKLFEYMAAGLAIVATRVGDVQDIIEHGRTGWLVRPDAPEALADAVAMLATDPDLCRRLGLAARLRAVERHGWHEVGRKILATASTFRHRGGRAA